MAELGPIGARSVLCLLALCALQGACSDGDSTSGDRIELRAWTIGPEPSSYTRKSNLIEGARRVNQELAEAGDGRRVVLTADYATSNHEAYMRKLVFAFGSERAPDIVCGGHELVGQFAPPGYLMPLDRFLDDRPEFRGDFFEVLWQAMSWRGSVYAIPQDNEVRLVYAHRDIFAKLGVSEADIASLADRIEARQLSLNDLADLALRAVDRRLVASGRGMWHRTQVGFDWLQFILAYGGRLENPVTGKLVLSRRATLATLQLFDRLVDGGATPEGMTGYPSRTIFSHFVAGDVFVYLTGGSWHKREFSEGYGLDDESFYQQMIYFPIPGGKVAGEIGPPVSVSHPFGCSISKSAPDAELAFRVIERSIDPDLDVRHALGSSHLVVRTSSSRVPAYQNDRFLQDMIGFLDYTHFAPNHAKLTLLQRILFDGIRGVEVGVLEPEEALEFVEKVGKARLGDNLEVED